MVGGTVIVEFEDVLFDTYKAELRYIQSRFTEFSAFMNYQLDYNFNTRSHKDPILDLVKNDNNDKFTNLLAINLRMRKFHEDKDSYTEFLELSNIGKHFFTSASLIDTSRVDKIIVLFVYSTEAEKALKESLWKELDYDEKFAFVGVKGQISVIDFMKKNQWDLYITSSRNVVKGLIEDIDYKLDKKEFMVLNRPYSKLDVKEETLIEEKGATINYFK